MAQHKIMKNFSMLGLPNLKSCFILINAIYFCDDSAECIILWIIWRTNCLKYITIKTVKQLFEIVDLLYFWSKTFSFNWNKLFYFS